MFVGAVMAADFIGTIEVEGASLGDATSGRYLHGFLGFFPFCSPRPQLLVDPHASLTPPVTYSSSTITEKQ